MNPRRSIKALLAAGLVAGALSAAPAALAAEDQPPAATAPTASTASAAAQASVYVWATGVNVRNGVDGYCAPSPSRAECPTIVAVLSRTSAPAYCQTPGETIHDSGYSNRWWTYVQTPSGYGWINNVYLQGGEKMAGVPDCTW